MRDKAISEFLKDLGSRTSTPGGGAVAGLNGAIAAAQLKMVAEFSKDEIFLEIRNTLAKKIEVFLELAEADIDVFQTVIDAYKSKDGDKIQQSLKAAARPSEETLDACDELLKICENNLDDFSRKLSADLIVTVANIKAAARSAAAMLWINAKSMQDGQPKNDIQDKIDFSKNLLARADRLFLKIEGL